MALRLCSNSKCVPFISAHLQITDLSAADWYPTQEWAPWWVPRPHWTTVPANVSTEVHVSISLRWAQFEDSSKQWMEHCFIVWIASSLFLACFSWVVCVKGCGEVAGILSYLRAKNSACQSFTMLEEHLRLLDWIQILLALEFQLGADGSKWILVDYILGGNPMLTEQKSIKV